MTPPAWPKCSSPDRQAEAVRCRLAEEEGQAAPHIVDLEVFGVIRRERLLGRIYPTASEQAFEDQQSWPGERSGHRLLLPRAWQLRDAVRAWDAMYVALDAVLLTTDGRLASATGPTCGIESIG